MFSLSYLDHSGQDGLGAQLVRFATLYSLTRKFKIPWDHTDILKVDRNPLDGTSKASSFANSLKELNYYLSAGANFQDRTINKLKFNRILSRKQLSCHLSIISLSAKFFKPHFSIALKYPQTYIQYCPNLLSYFSNDFSLKKTTQS